MHPDPPDGYERCPCGSEWTHLMTESDWGDTVFWCRGCGRALINYQDGGEPVYAPETIEGGDPPFPDFIKERCRWTFWKLTWDDGSVLFSDTWDGVEQVIKKNTGAPFVEPKRSVNDVLSAIRSSNAGVVIATSSGFVEFHYNEMTQGELNESFLREVIQSIRLSDHKLSGVEE